MNPVILTHFNTLLTLRQSYWWVGVPLIIYAIDRIVRWFNRFNPAVVYKAIEHPGPCLELRMRKRGWKQQAGQVTCSYDIVYYSTSNIVLVGTIVLVLADHCNFCSICYYDMCAVV